MLEKIHDMLWLVEGELVNFYGFPYPTRSVIVRLEGGDLWVWSPTRLTAELQAEVGRLGPVRHLVSPNKIHHLFLREWIMAYPQAGLCGPQSTISKRRDLTFRAPLEDHSPVEWGTEIDLAWFRGSIALDEVVFFHRPSATVIVADLIEALSETFLHQDWKPWQRVLARLDGITAKCPGAPREWRLSLLPRTTARAARDKVLGWPSEQVIMAHGDWPRSEGHAYLERSLAWLWE